MDAKSTPTGKGFGTAVLEQVMAEYFENPPHIEFAADVSAMKWWLHWKPLRTKPIPRHRVGWLNMERQLVGRIILVIEDEPLIALDIRQAFEDAGATVVMARTLAAALVEAEDTSISAAIVDHALGDGDSSEICERLKERNVPFVTYSGFANVEGACAEADHVNKPASPSVLVATVTGLLASRPISN